MQPLGERRQAAARESRAGVVGRRRAASFEAEYPLGENARAVGRVPAGAVPADRRRWTAARRRSTTFGLREIATEGTQFVLNGRKIFFRGTLECCIFPKTGYPPTDVECLEADHRRRPRRTD